MFYYCHLNRSTCNSDNFKYVFYLFLGAKHTFLQKKAGKKYKNLIAHLHLSIYTYNSFLYYVHVSVKILSTELKIKIKIVKNKKSLKYHSSVKTGDLIEYKVIWFASVGGKMQ